MEKLRNKKFLRRILMILILVMSLNFISPITVNAKDIGGVLMEPVANVLTSLGDGVLDIVHKFVMGQEHATLHSTSGFWDMAISAAIFVGVAVTLVVLPAGLGLPALASGVVLLLATGSGVFAYNQLSKDNFSLPVYSISPEEIFMNKIPLLDVNFFNPNKNDSEYYETMTKQSDVTGNSILELGLFCTKVTIEQRPQINQLGIIEFYYTDYKFNYQGKEYLITERPDTGNGVTEYARLWVYCEGENIESYIRYEIVNNVQEGDWGKYSERYQANIIHPDAWDKFKKDKLKEYDVYIDESEFMNLYGNWRGNTWEITSEDEQKSYKLAIKNYGTASEVRTLYTTIKYKTTSSILQPTIAKWYVTLRNVALVMSMSVLVYIGIRMMLTSVASQKAKYKTMLFDWLVGVGLIFIMQYIMVFGVEINDKFVELVLSIENVQPDYTAAIPNSGHAKKVLDKFGTTLGYAESGENSYTEKNLVDGYVGYKTNLMGNVRLLLQENRDGSLAYVGYVVMFLILIFYTVAFLFTYIKRVIYMALLTVLAPFVALAYPIDKVNDGQAQAFNMWIKEYLINLLIQPMHLLLYFILVSSAIDLATENVLYSVVALGFITASEKIIRSFFGFDKAKTAGILSGAAGAGLVMSAVGSLKRFGSSGKGSEDKKERDTDGKIRTKDSSISISDTSFADGMGQIQEETQKQVKEESIRQQKYNSIVAQQLNERLEELKSEGFEKGDREYDEIQEELDIYMKKAGKEQVKQAVEVTQAAIAKQQDNPSDSEEPTAPSRGGLRGAITGVAGGLGRSGLRLFGKLPNLAARGVGAATLGTVGLAAGIATGDAGNAFKYTLAGAGAGSALGSGIANRAEKSFENITDDAIRGFWGSDYDKYVNNQADRAFMASKANRDLYKAEFGSNYEERMKDALEYRKYGITDNDVIIEAINLPDKFGGADKTAKEKLYIALLASRISTRSDLARLRDSLVRQGVAPGKIDTIEEGICTIKQW